MKLLRVLRYLIGTVVLLASLALLAGWWIVRDSLPQLDGNVRVPELKAKVEVTRDRYGVPRIRAESLEDLLVAQGYVTAQDRLWQMDLLRRTAAGELSEIFGAVTLEMDRENRTLGLRVAAEEEASRLQEDSRAALEAYARGVNRYIEERRDRLPAEFRVLRYQPKPWRPADSLLVVAYMYKVLTETWDKELNRAKVIERVGAELARDLYVVESPLDHFIVGEAPATGEAKKAAQIFPRRNSVSARAAHAVRRAEDQAEAEAFAASPAQGAEALLLLRRALGLLGRLEEESELVAGSNNWVVNGSHTHTGKPLVANDTHLMLDAPCIWYMVHLTAPGWNVKGFSLSGGPLVIIGHNERIAWGMTNNGADVQDLYVETLNPANPREYRVKGQWVEGAIRREQIRVRGGADVTHEVMVTRHGPVVHREGNRAYALRWTALEPGGLWTSYAWLGRARNWEEFRETLRESSGPAQNIVYGDVDGNIGFIVAARVPVRKSGYGEVPVPGDTDDFEWTGYIPFEEMPVALNPPGGVIATANARVVGPGYKPYLTDHWVAPYRTARIYQLIGEKRKLRPEDCVAIQADIYTFPHRRLAEHLLNAAKKYQPKDERARDFLTHLPRWNGRAEAGSVEMAFLEFTRRAFRRRILQARLGDDWRLYVWFRSEVWLQNVLEKRPEAWLPEEFRRAGEPPAEGYDRLLIQSVDDAVGELIREADGEEKYNDWVWGRYVSLQMLHPLGRTGFLRRHLSISGVPQNGASHSVKQTGRSFGPAMRFVADLGQLDNSMMSIAMGQSGQFLSRHYRDQFSEWLEGSSIPSAFTDVAVEKAAVHRLVLEPGTPVR
jgi:penicillin amidase